MKKYTVLILSLLAATLVAQNIKKVGGRYANGFVGSYYSRIDGKELTFGLDAKAANDQSVWKTTDKNPPVSVRDAIASARRKLDELFPAKRVWTLESVTLKPAAWTVDAKDGIEIWDYVISFARHSDDPRLPPSHVDGGVTFIVLMDGTAVHPTIAPIK